MVHIPMCLYKAVWFNTESDTPEVKVCCVITEEVQINHKEIIVVLTVSQSLFNFGFTVKKKQKYSVPCLGQAVFFPQKFHPPVIVGHERKLKTESNGLS